MPKRIFGIYNGTVISSAEIRSLLEERSPVSRDKPSVTPNASKTSKAAKSTKTPKTPPPTKKTGGLHTPLKTKSYRDRGPEYFCRYCGAYIHKDSMQKHVAFVHPDGQVVKKNITRPRNTGPQHRVRCEYCRALIKENRLPQHIQKAHPGKPIPSIQKKSLVPPAGLVQCQFCSAFLRPDRIEKHNRRVHKSQTKQSFQKPKQQKDTSKTEDLEGPQKNTDSEAVIQSDRETLFGDKYVGQYRREFDGKFGSIPLYDDYGDEAGAD